jgi:hypothetical protein
MSVPTVSTSAWRLPAKNKAGAKRAGDFGRDAYAKLGLASVVESTEGVKDRPPERGAPEPPRAASSGGLPTVDTSGWTLSERKKAKGGATHRPKSELGKKWDDDPPEDRRGRPMLFGGEDATDDKVEMRGLNMDRIKQLRKLAGLEEDTEIKFQLGTPHRRMPEEIPAHLREHFEAPTRPERLSEDTDRGTHRLPPEIRRLVEGTRTGLPHGVGDATAPRRAHTAGILDPETKHEAHGDSYIDQVLAESKWFFRDFADLSLGVVSETPTLDRDDWSGSDTSYSDKDFTIGGDDDEEDDEDEMDDEEMGEARRQKTRHTKAGGRGRVVRTKKQTSKQHRFNVSGKGRKSKKNWEKSPEGRASRRRSARQAKHGEYAETDWDLHAEGIGKHIASLGRKMSGGTERSRKGLEKAKEKGRSFLKKHGFYGDDEDKPKRASKKRAPKRRPKKKVLGPKKK